MEFHCYGNYVGVIHGIQALKIYVLNAKGRLKDLEDGERQWAMLSI